MKIYINGLLNNALTLPIGIQYQDDGGHYHGDTFTSDSEDKEVTAEISSYDGADYIVLS